MPPGHLTPRDLRDYEVRSQKATKVDYRGLGGLRHGSLQQPGGTTIGEALNILENYDLSAMNAERALHHYLEASALALRTAESTSGTGLSWTSRRPAP